MKADTKKTTTVKTRYGSFLCIFEQEPDMGGYAVIAPKVPGAISWGKTLTEAKRMIAEAIEGAVEGEIIIAAQKAGQISIRPRRHIAA